MNIKLITHEFQEKGRLFEQLRGEGLFILEQALKKTDIKLHSMSSRIKELRSLLGKVKRKKYKNPLNEIHDIVGLRVVCLFLSDIERIAAVIRDSFTVLSEDNKIEGSDVSSFGYMSVHFIVTMKPEYAGPRYDHISKLPFEIQVRTIAMDAWANVSHYLDYKSDKDVPSDLRRDFYALSGLFYVADRHFEMFYKSSKQSQDSMTEFFEAATPQAMAQQEINLDSIKAYLKVKFPDREHASSKDISMLVDELLEVGYRTIGDVEEIIRTAQDAFVIFEKENGPGRKKKFTDTGVVRISAEIVNEEFARINHPFKREETFESADVEEWIKAEQDMLKKYRDLIKK